MRVFFVVAKFRLQNIENNTPADFVNNCNR